MGSIICGPGPEGDQVCVEAYITQVFDSIIARVRI